MWIQHYDPLGNWAAVDLRGGLADRGPPGVTRHGSRERMEGRTHRPGDRQRNRRTYFRYAGPMIVASAAVGVVSPCSESCG